ncbi:MAG: RecB family exonuclease [Candidatus Paceibacterota bacterium]
MQDKYTATWVSHTSISDFLNCPQSYYYKHVYRDPATNHKIKLVSPPLSLGTAVHEVVEELSRLPVDTRFSKSLIDRLETTWQKYSGKKGGFLSMEVENEYKKQGYAMLERLTKHPGPLKNLAVKIKQQLPYFWLSEKDNIILCGKIDWLEYLKVSDSVHIIDFKTSQSEESPSSLQLPIYHLLATNCQPRPVTRTSFWYIRTSDKPKEQKLTKPEKVKSHILKIAKEIKLARQLERFKCKQGKHCSSCNPMKAIVEGHATFVGNDEYNADLYILDKSKDTKNTSEIL